MRALFNLFLDICLFRRGPQDVPASPLLFGLAMLVYLIVGVVLLSLEGPLFQAVLQVFL